MWNAWANRSTSHEIYTSTFEFVMGMIHLLVKYLRIDKFTYIYIYNQLSVKQDLVLTYLSLSYCGEAWKHESVT